MAKKKGKKKLSRGHLPVKRTINLVGLDEKPINIKIAVPGIVLIVLLAAVFGKFGVADRLVAMSAEQSKVAQLQAQIDAGYAKIESFGELADTYAHYTYSGMTAEEVNRADRVAVVNMIRRVVDPKTTVESWTISGNVLQMTVTGDDLQEINLMAQTLEEEPIVDFCTVNNAATNDNNYKNTAAETDEDAKSRVTARVTVYLNGSEEEAAF